MRSPPPPDRYLRCLSVGLTGWASYRVGKEYPVVNLCGPTPRLATISNGWRGHYYPIEMADCPGVFRDGQATFTLILK